MSVNLVNLENVSVAHGTRTLLDAVSLGIAEGERIGVVGRNGGGKTTLLDTLTKAYPADSGRVSHAGGLTVAVLPQRPSLPVGATVRQVVLGDAATHEWASDGGVREVLDGLGLGNLGLDTVVDPLSGGERRRVALASLLVTPVDLLVLDEPTNHLDVEGVDWLARYLSGPSSRARALLAVTHDRWFLDAVCTSTWEVEGGQVHSIPGGYAAYVLAKAERSRIAASDEQRRQNLMKKELAWLRRGPPARTSKPQFRIDAANALIAAEPPPRDVMELQKFAVARLGKRVYDLEDVTLAAGDKVLLENLTWQIGPGDRIGLVGVNGAGKTTLLRLLMDQLEPVSGKVVRGVTIKPAYLSQEVVELDPKLRVLESVENVARSVELGKGKEMTASQMLDRFGFAGGAQWTPVGDLSGGERRRLQLLRLLIDGPNVLILDEPTNDLDVETLTVLEDLLDGWPGTLLVVSHDRYFLERVTDSVVGLLGDGKLRGLVGGVDEYLERRRSAEVVSAAGGEAAATPQGAEAKATAGDARAARKELTKIERRVQTIAKKETELHTRMAEVASDHAAVIALDEELRVLTSERDELEDRWLELSDLV